MSDVDDIYALHDDDLSPIENSSDRRMAGQDYQSEYHHEQPLQESSGFSDYQYNRNVYQYVIRLSEKVW